MRNDRVERIPGTVVLDAQMTFGHFVETKFLSEHVARKTGSGQTYYKAILKHLITPELVNGMFRSQRPVKAARLTAVREWPYLDDIRLCDLRADHVERLMSAADAAGYSTETATHIKNVFFAIISHAQKEGCFHGANPASLVKVPKLLRRSQRDLTFQETREILRLLQQPAKAIAIFTLTTEMTLKEICDLQWKHVNLGNERRYVEGEMIPGLSILARTGSDGVVPGDGPARGEVRILEIREPLLSTLRELSWLNPSWKADAGFVVSNETENVPAARSCTSDLKRVGRAIGIPWLTWQVLRRARIAIVEEFLSDLNTPEMAHSPRRPATVFHPVKFVPVYPVFRHQ